jgi:hypothetical protein
VVANRGSDGGPLVPLAGVGLTGSAFVGHAVRW